MDYAYPRLNGRELSKAQKATFDAWRKRFEVTISHSLPSLLWKDISILAHNMALDVVEAKAIITIRPRE